MSFIDLMSDNVWTEADIVNRMESLIRVNYSVVEEAIINRKIAGVGLGLYTLNADEQAELSNYASVCSSAQAEGRAARADKELLDSALEVESAKQTVADPSASDVEIASAQSVIDSATAPVLDLVTQRLARFQ